MHVLLKLYTSSSLKGVRFIFQIGVPRTSNLVLYANSVSLEDSEEFCIILQYVHGENNNKKRWKYWLKRIDSKYSTLMIRMYAKGLTKYLLNRVVHEIWYDKCWMKIQRLLTEANLYYEKITITI